MEVIQVDGLPADLVRTLRAMVQVMRTQLREAEVEPRRDAPSLPAWPGDVTRPVTREDLYGDAG